MVGHISLSDAGVWSEEIIVLNRVWHPRTTLTVSPIPHEARMCASGTGGAGSPVRSRGGVLMISRTRTHEHRGRDRGRGRCRKAGKGSQGANRRFQIMFRKFCFRKQAAGGFRRRGPTRRAFARCVRCRCTGFFSAVGRACLARHGAALIVGLAAPRRPRRQPRRLQLLVLGLRLPAASCLVGVALQPHIVAAWRRPPRGAPAGPRCPGRMRSGRPFKVADACCGLVHAQRPSGEYGLRGVARAFLCV